ncbi:MAG: NADH-quinone oxidoreductase subunit M [Bdellovibrionales bacterium]|nr:NADH-quinone oxidoreductase subunit M [Bdellovibrionales bacterium]
MLLSLIIFLPIFYGLIIWLLPEKATRVTAMTLSGFHFVFSLLILIKFDSATPALQLVEQVPWVPTFGISYFVGVDGISLWLVLLTTFLTPVTILGSWTAIENKVKGFHVAMFALEATMIGTFLAMDAVLFYVFFEASLIPMYFMIGIWGGPRKIYATVKFFIYTMFGSLFMLMALIALMFMTRDMLGGQMSASLLDFYKLDIPFVGGDFLNTQTLLFFAFALAFAIKVPMVPFHTWLPDAHVEAPTPGSVILAGVMLKMGTYGFMRFAMPLFPEAVQYWSWLFMFLAVFGIIYGALVAMVQPDIKKLVAYSSVSHMGYVILGLFAMNSYGMSGGLYQMLNHGISTGALFLMVGMVYEKTHSREISKYGGLAVVAPWYAILFLIVTMSSIAVPMTNGFIGEFLILLGGFQASYAFGVFAVSGVVLGAAYMLWMVKRVFFGAEGELVTKYKSHGLDLGLREMCVMAPLILLIFWMGIFPNHFLKFTEASVQHLLNNKNNYELTIKQDVPEKTFFAKAKSDRSVATEEN